MPCLRKKDGGLEGPLRSRLVRTLDVYGQIPWAVVPAELAVVFVMFGHVWPAVEFPEPAAAAVPDTLSVPTVLEALAACATNTPATTTATIAISAIAPRAFVGHSPPEVHRLTPETGQCIEPILREPYRVVSGFLPNRLHPGATDSLTIWEASRKNRECPLRHGGMGQR